MMPIYDNPATMRRECWHKEDILWWISSELINQKSTPKTLVPKWRTYPPPPPNSTPRSE